MRALVRARSQRRGWDVQGEQRTWSGTCGDGKARCQRSSTGRPGSAQCLSEVGEYECVMKAPSGRKDSKGRLEGSKRTGFLGHLPNSGMTMD